MDKAVELEKLNLEAAQRYIKARLDNINTVYGETEQAEQMEIDWNAGTVKPGDICKCVLTGECEVKPNGRDWTLWLEVRLPEHGNLRLRKYNKIADDTAEAIGKYILGAFGVPVPNDKLHDVDYYVRYPYKNLAGFEAECVVKEYKGGLQIDRFHELAQGGDIHANR